MLAAFSEFLQCIAARCVQQSAKRPSGAGPNSHKRFVDKLFYRALDFGLANFRFLPHGERLFGCEGPKKDPPPPQYNSFDLGKVIVAPIEGRFERLMPRIRSSAAEL